MSALPVLRVTGYHYDPQGFVTETGSKFVHVTGNRKRDESSLSHYDLLWKQKGKQGIE
jgi:hypothetical protein